MDDERIPELLSDMLQEMREMKHDIRDLKQEQKETNVRLERLDGRVEKLEQEQVKTNVQLFELRHSVITLAEHLELMAGHEQRISRIEAVVFKQ